MSREERGNTTFQQIIDIKVTGRIHKWISIIFLSACKGPQTLAASSISLEGVSSGADAAVGARQVDTLPVTHFLPALIYICVWMETGAQTFNIMLDK